ncbi:ribosome-inactivating family protein [Streptosporangium sp. NPDC020072]|uniref:ribosome-inactivating family protein n=1 Tax=Streptosporangium sp. NPDC020072 TaxID=3154788 RepID=UPI0034373E3D
MRHMVGFGKQKIAQRLGSILLSLTCVLGLVQVGAAGPANADTTSRWTIMNWDIDTLNDGGLGAAQSYGEMLNDLRDLAGEEVRNRYWETETVDDHYIELQIENNGDHFLSLYFRSSNLYLEGFTVRGQNYQFRDTPDSLMREFIRHYRAGNLAFDVLGYSSSYGELDAQGNRGNAHFTTADLYHYFYEMINFTAATQNNHRLRLANIIAATSEAVRSGWIRRRIQTVLHYGSHIDENGGRQTTLGGFGLALENNWSRLSRLAYRSRAGSANSSDYVNINGYSYQSLTDITLGNVPRRIPSLEGLLALGSSH